MSGPAYRKNGVRVPPSVAVSEIRKVLGESPPVVNRWALAVMQHWVADLEGLEARGVDVDTSVRSINFQEILAMLDQALERFALLAFTELPEADRQDLAKLIAERLRKSTTLEQVQAHGRTAIRVIVEQLVADELEAQRDVQKARIAALVRERFDQEVEGAARKLLDEALAKVKAELR